MNEFTAGACRTLAPDIVSIGRDAGRLGTSPTPPQEVRDSMKAAQDHLRAAQGSLEPYLTTPVQDLVIAVGVVRLRSDTNSFSSPMAADVSAAYSRLVEACTGPA